MAAPTQESAATRCRPKCTVFVGDELQQEMVVEGAAVEAMVVEGAAVEAAVVAVAAHSIQGVCNS